MTLVVTPILLSESTPQPVISGDAHWVGVMLLIIGALFVGALIIGLLVRTELPAEMLPEHAHDEPPGASHHHGTSGTEL